MKKTLSVLTLLASSALLSMALAAPASADVTATCAGCHGSEGTSSDKDLPVIGGMSAAYIKDTLAAYKSGERKGCPDFTVKNGDKKGTKTNMCDVAKGLSDADMQAAADHYSGKPFVKFKQTADDALAKKGKSIFEGNCEKCHTDGGTVKADDASILAGQPMPYLKSQLDDFLGGKRTKPEKMINKLKKLEAGDVDALVNFLGSAK